MIVFFTKEMMNPRGKLAPLVTLSLDRPGRPTIFLEARVPAEAFSASRDRCDVRIGENTFRGDLHEYGIHFVHGEVSVDIKLIGQVPAWRPSASER